ncbi:MAG: colanic acid exporter [Calditrichaeota bacterium]|nr:MAG: colanic acid exporter [Calditrichota bacterium]
MSSLRQKTVSGVLWSGFAKLAMQLVLLVVTSILAHLLSKEDFGIVGMAAIITVAVNMVNDKGLGMSLVQNKQVDRLQLSTIFWGSLFFGLLLYLISTVAAFPLAYFFRNPLVRPVVWALGLGFVVGSFGIVQKAILTRDMDFRKLALLEIVAVLISGAAAIVLALLGFGVWSLVVNSLLRDLLNTVGLWLFCKWRPHLYFSWKDFRSQLGFSSNVLANDGAIYMITNVDVTIIGRVLGSAALGVYNLSLYLVKLPVTRISGIVAKVVFPAFSAVQDEPLKFKKAYLRSMTFISIFTFPVLVGLAVFSHEFIMVFLGEKWIEMATPLILLTPMAMLKSVGTIRGSVLMAVGRPEIELRWNLVYLLPLIAAVYGGTYYGINGVAFAFSALYLLTFPIIQYLTNRQINVNMLEFFGSLSKTFIAVLFMGGVGMAVRFLSQQVLHLPSMILLFSGVIISILGYIFALQMLDKKLLTELGQILSSGKKKEAEFVFVEDVNV